MNQHSKLAHKEYPSNRCVVDPQCVEEIVIINDLERGVYAYDVESWANATLRADERCELFDGTVA